MERIQVTVGPSTAGGVPPAGPATGCQWACGSVKSGGWWPCPGPETGAGTVSVMPGLRVGHGPRQPAGRGPQARQRCGRRPWRGALASPSQSQSHGTDGSANRDSGDSGRPPPVRRSGLPARPEDGPSACSASAPRPGESGPGRRPRSPPVMITVNSLTRRPVRRVTSHDDRQAALRLRLVVFTPGTQAEFRAAVGTVTVTRSLAESDHDSDRESVTRD